MGVFQRVLGAVFPQDVNKFVMAIISALPDEFSEIRNQTLSGQCYSLNDWESFPDFKFVSIGYCGDSYRRYKKRGLNYKIAGLKIFSKQNNGFENIEILVNDNLICGIRISNSAYRPKEFDIQSINADSVVKTDFAFPPSKIDLFYDGLNAEIKQRLEPDDIEEIDMNNRTYYSFHDLEDGNCLAVDKKLKVYSLVHDAMPVAKAMKIAFNDILNEIAGSKFDADKHLDERYRG